MTRRDCFDCVRRDDSRAAGEHGLVKSPEVVNRSAAVAAGPLYRDSFRGVGPRPVGKRLRAFEFAPEMHRRDALAVFAPSVGRHSDPSVAHLERLKDLLANILTIRATVGADPQHDLAQDVPCGRDVVARGSTDDPPWFDFRLAYLRDNLVLRIARPRTDRLAKTAGMRHDVLDGD